MKTQRVLIALTAINLVLLVFLLSRASSPVAAQASLPVLRGSALEIVDARGQIRASITVNPPEVVDSQSYPETVLLRLRDPRANGGPGVTIQTNADGSGIRLADGSEIGAIDLTAKARTGSSVKVTSRDGRERLLQP